MIGNDIIDIKETKLKTNWERRGFLQKVFSSSEQYEIEQSSNKFNTVWRMWSMKESAYKLYLQSGKARFFDPRKMACEIISISEGIVKIKRNIIKTFSKTEDRYIFSTAVIDQSLQNYHSEVVSLHQNDIIHQSRILHQNFIQHIALKLDLKQDMIRIRKTQNGVPKLFYKNQKLDVSFSLSHHGKFAAFSIINN